MSSRTSSLRPYLITMAVLIGIFAVAFFIRSYFAFDVATSQGFLVSGGSDSFYHKRIIDRAVQTGEYLHFDPLLNYPLGYRNPRAPGYSWSTVLMGYLIAPFVDLNLDVAVWWSFEFGTALWGALTIFPTYLLAKEAFGKRTGYVAAFFLAIMPAHIQRSPFSDADHDAMVLFFVVLSFYFFLKALRSLREATYISRWSTVLTNPRGFLGEVRAFFVGNRAATLYGLMAGLSLTTVALTWQGWPYALLIYVGYLLVQLIVHRFRNQDPFGVLAIFALMGGVTLLLVAPYYVGLGFYRAWYDTPLFMYLGALGFGLAFTTTRRYPWVLSVPAILAAFAVAIVIVGTFLYAGVGEALLSGFGYFPRNKIYETIAEAQPPGVSIAIISFGAVTYYLSLLGIAWMIYQFPRKPVPDYIFVVVWAFASIFMAMTQVRFLFNASAAFAVTAGLVTILIVERLKYDEVGKTLRGTIGRGRLAALRKGIKVRHVVGGLFIAFLLVLPNIWLAVDAATPFEAKEDLDQEVANTLPPWLRPPGYQEGQLFYFGAFGFSTPLPSRYFPRAWDWLGQQDRNVTPSTARPAYLSWWDYGFEVVQETGHPTVADNFQNGIETAGNFLAAQSENQAIAIMSLRLLDGDFYLKNRGKAFSPNVAATLQGTGLSPTDFADVYARPSNFIAAVLDNPGRFGPYDERMSPGNAKVIYLSTLMKERLATDGQAQLYDDLQAATGWSIGYVSVDSRLIPFSAQNTGIFYAPMKLSDHRVVEQAGGRVVPIDFFRVKATVGNQEFDITEVSPAARITDVRIEYQDMFYNSMLYRTVFGISPSEAGGATNGLPSMAGEAQAIEARPGWMLSHFRQVYRTAYYNPYPPVEVANHTEAWEAVNLPDAIRMQGLIDQGKLNGTVDASATTGLQNGIVFLRYYQGALVRGKVTTADGTPLGGILITVQDEFGIPHYVHTTDAQGNYRVLAPFGRVDLKASTGSVNNGTMVGSSLLASTSFNVTEAQAQGEVPDFSIGHDFRVAGQSLSGRVFFDANGNGRIDPGESGVDGAEVRVSGSLNLTATLTTNGQGAFFARNLLPGIYDVNVTHGGRSFTTTRATINPGVSAFHTVNVSLAGVSGRITYEDGSPGFGAAVTLRDHINGTSMVALADRDGRYSIDGLLPGNFTVRAELPSDPTIRSAGRNFSLAQGVEATQDITVTLSSAVQGRVTVSGVQGPGAPISFRQRGTARQAFSTVSGPDGTYSLLLPVATYDVYSTYQQGSRMSAFLGSLTVTGAPTQGLDLDLTEATLIRGTTFGGNFTSGLPSVTLEFQGGGGALTTRSGRDSRYGVLLPADRYVVTAVQDKWWTQETLTLPSAGTFDIRLSFGRLFSGYVFRDLNGNLRFDPTQEGVANAPLEVRDDRGHSFTHHTDAFGFFSIVGFNGTSYGLSTSPPGYSSNSTAMALFETAYANQTFLRIQANPVPVSGSVTVDGSPVAAGKIMFQGRGKGAANATAALGPDGGYSLSLVPGEYVIGANISIGAGTNAFTQSNDSFVVRVALPSMSRQVELMRRHLLTGLMTIDGVRTNASVTFQGPEQQAINALNGTYRLYLRPGSYNVHTLFNRQGTNYVYIRSHDISGPATIDLPLARAATVSGSVRVSGPNATVQDRTILGRLSMNFTRVDGGGRLEVSATAGGSYTTILLPGDYGVEADHHTTDNLDGVSRYVRYRGVVNVTVVVDPSSPTLDITFRREFDNSTLRGVVRSPGGSGIGASMAFRATDAAAINTRATASAAGEYSVQLAPGRYDLYALGVDGTSVFLGAVTADPRSEALLDLPLSSGRSVRGTVTYGTSIPTAANLTVVSESSFEARAAVSGSYALLVPPGTYRLEATASVPEKSTRVLYQGQGNVTVGDTDERLDLMVTRLTRYGVGLRWDSSQAQTIPAGASVTHAVTVQNRGSVQDSFRLSGEPSDWSFSFDRETVVLDFGGASNETTVLVSITAPASAIVEHPPVAIVATSDTNRAIRNSVVVQVDIEQRQALELKASSSPATYRGQVVDVPVSLRNAGNGGDRFFVDIINAEDLLVNGWNATLVHPATGAEMTEMHDLSVAANGTQDVVVRLRLQGQTARTGTIQVVARPETRQDLEQRVEVAIPIPSLSLGTKGVQVTGPGTSTSQPFPWTLVIPAAVALGALGLFLWGRQRARRRGGRRRRK